MVKKVIAVVLFVGMICPNSLNAQSQDEKPQATTMSQAAAARMAAGCGPNDIQFEVKTDKKQHPQAQPEAEKAIVYVFSEAFPSTLTMRTGIDGKWAGASYSGSYFFFTTGPGEHRLCMDKQSSGENLSNQGAAIAFTAEAGRIYYFTAELFDDVARPKMKLERLDSAEGLFMVSSFSFSSSHMKPSDED
jgi:hypothetical protein